MSEYTKDTNSFQCDMMWPLQEVFDLEALGFDFYQALHAFAAHRNKENLNGKLRGSISLV